MTVELTYRKLGDGSANVPLIILHGLLGSAGNWRTIARDLEPGRTIYCLNLRNHGDSPHCAGMSYPEMADDVLAFIERETLGQPDILGHSMGGKVAMTLALEKPDRVGRLVVVDIAPVDYPSRTFPMLDAMMAVDLHHVERRSDADRLMADALPEPVHRSFVLTNLRRDASGYNWRVNLAAVNNGLVDIMGFPDIPGPFTGPTLFLGGEESDYIHGYEDAIKARFPNATIRFINGAGHWPHADCPLETTAAIQHFLNAPAEASS